MTYVCDWVVALGLSVLTSVFVFAGGDVVLAVVAAVVMAFVFRLVGAAAPVAVAPVVVTVPAGGEVVDVVVDFAAPVSLITFGFALGFAGVVEVVPAAVDVVVVFAVAGVFGFVVGVAGFTGFTEPSPTVAVEVLIVVFGLTVVFGLGVVVFAVLTVVAAVVFGVAAFLIVAFLGVGEGVGS